MDLIYADQKNDAPTIYAYYVSMLGMSGMSIVLLNKG